MLGRIKRNGRAAAKAYAALRADGHAGSAQALLQLTSAAAGRCYRVASRPLNASKPLAVINRRRIRAVRRVQSEGITYYVIVVPGTLHFLLPCLALIPSAVQVVLVGNGATAWEMQYLQARFPGFPQCRLLTLPASSLTHGAVITLLLECNETDFGIIDHDFYAFDERLFLEVQPGERCYATAVYGDVSPSGITFPHTFFLYFNTRVLQELMKRYGITAEIYRKAPRSVAPVLESIGLHERAYLKQHHQFFDTLTLLYVVATAHGFQCRFLQDFSEESVTHLGSTSSGTAKTKPPEERYVHLRFLETFGDRELWERYESRYAGASDASGGVRMPALTPEKFAKLQKVDALITRLQRRVHRLEEERQEVLPADARS